jgi:predicted nucleic acid-binding protein
MGSLILPSSGPVYADALIFIYSVEKHSIYALTLRPLWEAVARGDLEVLSSELTLMETLIGPLKQGDAALETDYENFFASPGIRLLPITSSILRAGARLRATLGVKK